MGIYMHVPYVCVCVASEEIHTSDGIYCSLLSKASSIVVNPDIVCSGMAGRGVGDTVAATHSFTADGGPAGSSVGQFLPCLVEVAECGIRLLVGATHLGVFLILALLLSNYSRNIPFVSDIKNSELNDVVFYTHCTCTACRVVWSHLWCRGLSMHHSSWRHRVGLYNTHGHRRDSICEKAD